MIAQPLGGVDDPPRPQSGGFAPWSEDDIAVYESRWPVGTRQRVWLDVLIYTGLRRGDAVRFGRQHVRNGVGTIKTEKTGTEVTLPILPVLDATLKAGPCGDLTFIAGENGRPSTKESFGNLSAKPAAMLACMTVRRTAYAKPLPLALLAPARPWQSWKRFSDGKVERWPRSQPASKR
jgi:integrase